MRWIVVTLLLGMPAAFAINAETLALLNEARALAAQAEATYETHYPDRPLWRAAIRKAEAAARLEPQLAEVWRTLAEIYTQTQWWIRAEQAWNKYLELGGEGDPAALARAYLNLGYAAYQRGALDEAIARYERAAQMTPENPEPYGWLGRLYLEKGDPKAALPYWERAAALDPSPRNRYFLEQTQRMVAFGREAVSSFYKGYAAYEQGDKASALLHFVRAAELAPEWAEAARWAGRVSLEQGLAAQAVPYWERVMALEGRTAETEHFLKLAREGAAYGLEAARAFFAGLAAYEAGELEAAVAWFERATAANDAYAKAWRWLGRANYELERFKEAAAAYARAVELDPNDQTSRYFLRLARQAAGE